MNEYNSICLNMIVKNESHVIKSTLENLYKYIKFSYYVISDTGSTDNTVEIIKEFFDSNNVKGEIYNDEWKDFGYNRTLALNYAYKKSKYLFIFDADDKIYGEFYIPPNLEHDGYYLKFGNNTTYKRILLINNNLKWQFKGVLHEYLECTDKNILLKYCDILGNYFIDSGKTGSRSKDPLKYSKDAEILSQAFYEAEKNNDDIKIRYAFYTAQSYRDSNQKEKAIEWYKKRILLNNWNQETYYSYYMIGNLYNDLNQIEQAIYYWTLAYEEDNERYETLYNIISHFRKNNKYLLAYQYYLMIKNKNPDLKDKLFASFTIYSYLLDYELIIIFYHNKKFKEAIPSFLNIFENKNKDILDINILLNIFDNFRFYTNHIELDINLYHNFYNFTNNLLKNITFNRQRIEYLKDITQSITNNYNNSNFLKSIINNLRKNDNSPTIFLSMTTCKRYDLFVKTINSILVCFKDIRLIDYFFCIDDNSSTEDRSNMIRNYPFFQYYLKKESEKGHLSSMNIIWNKLNELKPKYWIHIEDDWLFFKPDNYIIKSIKFLEKYKSQNISQILFNKNYAETFDDLDIVGGKKLDDDFILHIKDEPNLIGKNCAYWPHYSFRPSVCLVDTILKLGNFDTEITFFEREYSNKYFLNGFQSAFFNEITSIHIGKLTSDKNSNNKNAYQLNNITQFNSNNNLKKEIDNTNYVYIKNKDHYGNDLFYKPDLSINEMISLCDENENIIAFNSLGYFKNEININTLIDLNIPNLNNNDIGLFINITRFNKINNTYLFSKINQDIDKDINQVVEQNVNHDIDKDINQVVEQNIDKDINLDLSEKELSDLINKPKYRFTLFKNKTIDNNEIEIIPTNDLSDLIKYTINNNNCIGFSTNGSMKNNIHLNLLKDINNIDTFIDIDKYIKVHYTDFTLKNPFITIIDNYLFIKNKDYIGNDIDFKNNLSINEMIQYANENNNCKSFNTLGFFKNNINLNEIITNQYINNNNHGIFIKINELNHNLIIKNINTQDNDFKDIDGSNDKLNDNFVAYHSQGYYKKDLDLFNPVFSNSIYNDYLSIDILKLYLNKLNIKKKSNKIRIKLICDFSNSFELCKEFNKMSMGSLQWNNLEFTFLDDFIDYYVILDGLFEDTYFIPSKTIFFITKDVLNPIIIKYNFLHIENIFRFSWNFNKTYIELNNYINTNKINKFNFIISEDIKDFEFNNLDKDLFNNDLLDNDTNNIFDYNYVIIIEKDINDRLLFDKVFDCMLNNCLVFYYGNNYIFNYFDTKSIIMLDNYKPNYLNNIMKLYIANDLYNSKLEFINKEKHKILNKYNIFAMIEKIISN